jgi:hypothetical protein
MNKEIAIGKINKIGRVAGIITIIARIFVILGITGCILGTVAVALLPKNLISYKFEGGFHGYFDTTVLGGEEEQKAAQKIVDQANVNIKLNGVDYDDVHFEILDNGKVEMMAKAHAHEVDFRKSIMKVTVTGAVVCAFAIVSLTFLIILCRHFEHCTTPFSDEIIRSLKNFAYSLIPWVLIKTITNTIFSGSIMGSFDMDVTIDLSMVVIVLVILALAYIFSYGAVLQRESDETL